MRDLRRAFMRAIPPACRADPIWGTLPLGDAGKLEIAIRVDGTGHIVGAEPRGKVQPQALVNVLRRTLPLLEAGTFALRPGATSEGTEILELRGNVREGVDDSELDSGAQSGKAAFSHASARRVEIAVRVVKIEAGG